MSSLALNLAQQGTGPLPARLLTRANLSKLVFRWLHLLRWPTRQQNSRERAMLTCSLSSRMPATVSQLGTTFNPLTPNAPLSGAVARSAEASAPRAGWASAGAFLLSISLPRAVVALLCSLLCFCTTFLTRRHGHTAFQCPPNFATQIGRAHV